MNKSLLIITWSVLMPLSLFAQSKLGIENYYYPGTPGTSAVVPVIHFESQRSWRGELRYNYEDANTLSLFAGKTFKWGKELQFNFSPMIGFSTGDFAGLSLAANMEAEWKNVYLSSQNQYSRATNGEGSFLFTWSEIGYEFAKHFFGGLAVQYTKSQGINQAEPGFVGGFTIGNLTVPFYAFSPFTAGSYYVAGVIYECNFNKRKK
jgi:hypothetical protein